MTKPKHLGPLWLLLMDTKVGDFSESAKIAKVNAGAH